MSRGSMRRSVQSNGVNWKWIIMIMLPDGIMEEDVKEAIETTKKRSQNYPKRLIGCISSRLNKEGQHN
ncbi:MAG: hypothetical protein JW891_11590 [Candidatus Lokiarchaeota archaeon]|nr:hypothetical protein [Candidatus Lokiarchaeota archaeon]